MGLIGVLRLALTALTVHKLRSALTMLGVIIGVASVIALVAVGAGMQQEIEDQYEAMGVNLLTVSPQYSGDPRMPGAGGALTEADVEALHRHATAIRYIAPEVMTQASVVYRTKSTNCELLGVTAAHARVRNLVIDRGRFIGATDDRNAAMVAVLAAPTAREIFGKRTDPIGQTIRINRLNFKVVGVLRDKGSAEWLDSGLPVLVPLRTAQIHLRAGSRNQYTAIHLQITDTALSQFAEAQVRTIIRARHRLDAARPDDFWVQNQEDDFRNWRDWQQRSTRVLGVIAAIALLVGGIGIMNIMLVSVTERTREIGLRKAVGAKRRHILAQFLAEATVLSLVGGAIGVGAGVGLSKVAAEFIAPLVGTSRAVVTPDSIALALGVSLLIGVFFGFYPAQRAARLNPIQALRYE